MNEPYLKRLKKCRPCQAISLESCHSLALLMLASFFGGTPHPTVGAMAAIGGSDTSCINVYDIISTFVIEISLILSYLILFVTMSAPTSLDRLISFDFERVLNEDPATHSLIVLGSFPGVQGPDSPGERVRAIIRIEKTALHRDAVCW